MPAFTQFMLQIQLMDVTIKDTIVLDPGDIVLTPSSDSVEL